MNVSTRKFARAKLAASLAGAMLVLGSGALQADPKTETRTMAVSYADLNLSTPAGVQALHQRIQSAARTLCGSQHDRQLHMRRSARTCYRAAVADAATAVEQKARLQQRGRLQVYSQ